ncbi:hypothetical protein AB0H73_38000 [Streptomyces olivoreticuli]
MTGYYSTLMTVGFAVLGLALALRINQHTGRPVHNVVAAYGVGMVGVSLLGATLHVLAW